MSAARIAALALAAALVDLVLIQPNHPSAAGWGTLRVFPLELPAILLGLAALGLARSRGLRVGLVAFLVLMVLVKTADLASFAAYGRAADPVTDLHLLPAGARLLSGAIGTGPALALGAGLVLLLALLAWLLSRALRTWARLGLTGSPRWAAGLVALAFLALSVAETGHIHRAWRLPANPPGDAMTTRLAYETVRDAARSRAAFRTFAAAAEADPMADRTDLFAALDRRDVQILFLESYGRASLDNPRYAIHRQTLTEGGQAIAAAGYAVRHLPELPDALRITIGKAEDMARITAVLRELCGETA